MLNFRLVCKAWKSAVDNSTQIMKKLIFNVNDWSAFLKSTLLNKVKSIIINKLLLNGNKMADWFKICTRIGKTIQMVKFDFYTMDTNILEINQLCI